MGQCLFIHQHSKMPMSKEQGEKGQHGYTILQVVIGIIMISLGSTFQDDCPNGATKYLFNAGIVILVANLVALLAVGVKILAEKDGKVTCMESMGLLFINMVSGLTERMILETITTVPTLHSWLPSSSSS